MSKESAVGKGSWSVRCPVVVHRWFADGEGWAHCEGFDSDEVIMKLGDCLRCNPGPQKGQVGMLELARKDECVVYTWCRDETPADPKAVGRHPTILRAVVLPGRPHGERVKDILDLLETSVILPSRRGVSPGFRLEIPADWIRPRPSSATPACESAKARSRLWRTGMMIGSFLLIGVFVVAAGGWSLGLFVPKKSEIVPQDVYDQLLRPLGIEMTEKDRADAALVRLKFREVYCQSWFINRFFPGAGATLGDKPPEELLSDIEAIFTRLNVGLKPDENVQSVSHPDSEFVQVNRDVIGKSLERFCEFEEAIKYLPRHATDQVKSNSFSDGIPRDPKAAMTRGLNEVAKKISESDRRPAGLPVADAKALLILSESVVKPARDFMKQLDQLNNIEWFTGYEWRQGEAFPWDHEPDAECQQLVYLLLPQQQFPSDVREAAEEMRIKLCEEPWNVRGIAEQDVERRPWFVGRCFVEFLSRKHFTAEEEKLISESRGFVVEHLRKLPVSGWVTSGEDGHSGDWRQLWNEVRKGLEELAKSVGVNSGGSDAARVQEVSRVLRKWEQERREGENKGSAAQNEIDSLLKQRAEWFERRQQILREKQEIASLDARYQELHYEESELIEKIQRIDDQIRVRSVQVDAKYFSVPEGRVGDFWRRLTGSQNSGDSSESVGESDMKEG